MHKPRRVKQDQTQSYAHRSTRGPDSRPSVRAFLGRHPLPPELKPYQSAIEKFPDVGSLLDTLFGLLRAGFSVEQIGDALNRVATHVGQGAQRCACCLSWTDDGATWGCAHEGTLHLLTVCPKCAGRITSGKPTPAMERNVAAYVQGGAL